MLKLIKFCIVCLFGFSITACGFTSKGNLFREALKQKGKVISGQTLENSEWYMCRGASIGSVKDRYGVSDEKTLAYNNICKTDSSGPASVINPGIIIKEEVPNDVIL